MTLPVSSYEELLEQVRELTNETVLLQEQLSDDLLITGKPTIDNQNRIILTQKNYEKGKGLKDNVIAQYERPQLLETSQTLPSSKPNQLSKVSESQNVGLKIPPGDPTSRLIAWRKKNSHLFPTEQEQQQQQQQQQQDADEQEEGERTWPRRPVSLHGPRENILFGSNSFGLGAAPRTSQSNFTRLTTSLQLATDASTTHCPPTTAHLLSGLQTRQLDESSEDENAFPTSPLKADPWSSGHSTSSLPSHRITAPTKPTTHNINEDFLSVMSFSSSGSGSGSGMQGQRRLGAKMDVVYSLLSMLGSTEGREDMSATLLSMSNSVDSCAVMRQSGCLPLLIQLIHAPGQDPETRERASRALYNIVHAKNEEKSSRREARVLRLLEQLRDYCQSLRTSLESRQAPEELESHPGATIAALMKLSFDEAHRHAMCQLGGLHAVAELIEMDHAAHSSESEHQNCITLRRYAGMALTNLTFGDGNNKALLCSFQQFMKALVSQLGSPSDDLRQVTASVLRNLSWRADSSSKQTLREVGAVIGLMKAAMEGRKESTLKSILSALWNLSAHCSTNKMDICAVEGALAFLVDMLSYNAPSKTLAIVENAGGILRNVSSHIAVREDYRAIVRERGCLQVLLRQLRSPSLTVVSNACGALWNLSARCPQDQRLLWDLGAVPMLRSLVHSKHKMISMGSSAALKNLLSARPNGSNLVHMDSTARGLGLPTLPSLMARRQKALEQEIDQNLAETCDNIEPSTSPQNKEDKFSFKIDQSLLDTSNRSGKCFHQAELQPPVSNQAGTSGLKFAAFTRSESRESMRSVTSTHSDTIFEKVNRQARNAMSTSELQMKQQSASLHSAINFDSASSFDRRSKGLTEKKYTLRYMHAIPERLKPGEPLPDLRGLKCSTSTISWAGANQDGTCSKALLHSSVDDCNLSMSNSCSSSNSKAGINSDSSSCNFSAARAKSTAPFNGVEKYNLPINSIKSGTSSMVDPFNDYAETDLDQPTDYSLRYAELSTSDEDKQSSAYFTGTEQEQDIVKTYCTEGTPYHSSLNSSRASSASDLHEESRSRAFSRKSLETTQRISSNASKHLTLVNPTNCRSSSRTDSLRSTTTSESTLTLQVGRSLESDSAIFEADPKLGQSSGVPSLSSLVEDEPNIIVNQSKQVKINSMHHEADSESFSMQNMCHENEDDYLRNNELRQSFRKGNYDDGAHSENNVVRFTKNPSLSDIEIENVNDDVISGKQPAPLTSLESVDQQQLQDDEDYSEITYTNDYYTVQETYTLDKDARRVSEKLFPNDDCSLSQQCSSTLSYMSVEDKDHHSAVGKNVSELMENMQPAETWNSESCESFDSIERSEQALLELCIKSGMSKSERPEQQRLINTKLKCRASKDVSETIVSANLYKSTGETGDALKGVTGRLEEEYRRQRDPDAMIASLDRLTATLVQQTEAMRERDSSAMKASLLSDTWNEDSPNEVSFPSISLSAPLVASFKSELEDCCGIPNSEMTDSNIIEIEAIKLAEAVRAQANQASEASIDLEEINPPSSMGSLLSLTASIGPAMDNADNSAAAAAAAAAAPTAAKFDISNLSNGRKKSLPLGVVARRALSHGQNRTGSLENLLNECNTANHSQLENVKPPSIMDELLDMGDMENSMLSVASITSEIADNKDSSLTSSDGDVVFDLLKPCANVLSLTCIRYAETMQGSAGNSLSERLENINPPSLFNEVSQMDDSATDGNTLCIDASELCSEEAATPATAATAATAAATRCVFDERIEEIANDTDEAATPLSSEHCSSVESTPKRHLHKNHPGHLTPKQKRQLAKERYKTYTIAAERVKKEQDDRRKQEQEQEQEQERERGNNAKRPFSKLTPKQRRQEDRARFQTQVLDTTFSILDKAEQASTPDKSGIQSLVKSGIPMLRKFPTTSKASSFKLNTSSCPGQEVKADKVLGQDKSESENESDSEREGEGEGESELINGVSRKLEMMVDEEEVESQSEEDCRRKEESQKGAKGPRIVKPAAVSRDLSLESEPPEAEVPKGPNGPNGPKGPKAIRGRRKPLYSTPSTRKSTPQSSPLKQTGLLGNRSNSSPIVRPTRATTLRQNNSFQKSKSTPKINASGPSTPSTPSAPSTPSTPSTATTGKEKRPASAKRTSIPQKAPSKLERQGTFTKDEPEVDNAPMVSTLLLPSSPNKTNLMTKPLVYSTPYVSEYTSEEYFKAWGNMKNTPPDSKTRVGKALGKSSTTGNIVGKSKISLRTVAARSSPSKPSSVEKALTPSGIPSIGKRSFASNLGGAVVKSSSNYQIAPSNENSSSTTTTTTNSGIPRKISLGQRSNSNSSIVSNASNQGTRKMVKEATSKIASLWKKVEENKSRQRFEKADTRLWITPNRASTQFDSQNQQNEQTSRLFRSSTFEGVTTDSDHSIPIPAQATTV